MRFLTTFQAYDFLDTLVSLTAAFVLATLIGAERQYRLRTAGLRTNVLVAVSAAAFVDIGMHLTGADLVAQAAALTAFVLAGNTLLRPLVNAINRRPLDERASEATYEVLLTVDAAAMSTLRETLVAKLEAAQYPVSDVQVIDRTDDVVEIIATLVSTAVEAKELDSVTVDLARLPGVRHATWNVSTKD
jgi:putative Mg2+ transporter-C (MgtC) family protein